MSHQLATAILPLGEAYAATAIFSAEIIPVATAQADLPENLVPLVLAATVIDEADGDTFLLSDAEDGNFTVIDENGVETDLVPTADPRITVVDEENEPTFLSLVEA